MGSSGESGLTPFSVQTLVYYLPDSIDTTKTGSQYEEAGVLLWKQHKYERVLTLRDAATDAVLVRSVIYERLKPKDRKGVTIMAETQGLEFTFRFPALYEPLRCCFPSPSP